MWRKGRDRNIRSPNQDAQGAGGRNAPRGKSKRDSKSRKMGESGEGGRGRAREPRGGGMSGQGRGGGREREGRKEMAGTLHKGRTRHHRGFQCS